MQTRQLVTDDLARLSSVLSPTKSRSGCAKEPGSLTSAFCRGEKWAAERLIAQATPRVTTLVRRLLAWSTDVEDVVHDVFVEALVARKKFRRDADFTTWITRIAINRCRAHNRRQWLREKLFAAWRERQLLEREASERVAGDEQAENVRQIVAALPQAYREVVVLYYLEQMSAVEVAQVLELKVNTVEKRLSRARQRLADSWERETP